MSRWCLKWIGPQGSRAKSWAVACTAAVAVGLGGLAPSRVAAEEPPPVVLDASETSAAPGTREPTAKLTLLVLPYGYGERTWARPRNQWQPRQRWARPYWRDDWRWRYAPDRTYNRPPWRGNYARGDYARGNDSWRDRDGRWTGRDRWSSQPYDRGYGVRGDNWRSADRFDGYRW